MNDQEKHLKQSRSAEEKAAIKGAQNAAEHAADAPKPDPITPVPNAGGISVSPPPAPPADNPDKEPGEV